MYFDRVFLKIEPLTFYRFPSVLFTFSLNLMLSF